MHYLALSSLSHPISKSKSDCHLPHPATFYDAAGALPWFLRSTELMIPAPIFHGAAPSACDTLLPDSHMAGSSPLSNRCSNVTSLESHPMIVRTAPRQSSPRPSAALFYSEYWLLPTFIPVNLKMDFLYCYNTSLMKTGIFFLSCLLLHLHCTEG